MRLVLGPWPGAVRLQLRRLLGQMPGVEVVAQAFHNDQLPALIAAHQPHWLLLDGIEALESLRAWPDHLTRLRGCVLLQDTPPRQAPWPCAVHTLACPQDLARQQVNDPFCNALARCLGTTAHGEIATDRVHLAPAPTRKANSPFALLAIGASTGGPQALATVLEGLGGRLSVPVVVTQHIGQGFSSALAQSLTQRCGLPVHEAMDGQWLVPGEVYLAPAGRHLQVQARHAGSQLRLDDGPAENFCKPSVDVMLRSLAAPGQGRVLVLMLTGMGQDGLEGARLLHRHGACILAQDEASSVVWGMPGAVAKAGLCEAVLPPSALIGALLQRLGAAP